MITLTPYDGVYKKCIKLPAKIFAGNSFMPVILPTKKN